MDLSKFQEELARQGIDIVHPLDVRWYNEHVVEHELPLSALPTLDRQDGTLALLIGNSRALWAPFLAWIRAQPDPTMPDPLDTFISSVINLAVEKLTSVHGTRVVHDIFWPWEKAGRMVSMQRAAVASAMCYHDTESQLAIHPKYGAWVAFRAVVVIDAPPPCTLAPRQLACLLSPEEKAAAREAMAAALCASDEANLCTQLHGAKGMERDVRLAWAALRDCVLIGKEERYSEAQLTYHYTKDQAVLMQALADSQP